jgi:hypothetical protein
MNDLPSQISNIFGRRQTFGQYMGNVMPTMARYDFGANDPSSAYASRLPRVGRMMPPAEAMPAPAEAAPQPEPMALAPAPGMGGGQGLRPSAAPSMPEMGGAQGMQAPSAPSMDSMGGGQGLAAPRGLLEEPSQGVNWGRIEQGARAFSRGQGDQSRGRGESMYAPSPSVMSAGPVGGRAGADVDVTRFMRGGGRR